MDVVTAGMHVDHTQSFTGDVFTRREKYKENLRNRFKEQWEKRRTFLKMRRESERKDTVKNRRRDFDYNDVSNMPVTLPGLNKRYDDMYDEDDTDTEVLLPDKSFINNTQKDIREYYQKVKHDEIISVLDIDYSQPDQKTWGFFKDQFKKYQLPDFLDLMANAKFQMLDDVFLFYTKEYICRKLKLYSTARMHQDDLVKVYQKQMSVHQKGTDIDAVEMNNFTYSTDTVEDLLQHGLRAAAGMKEMVNVYSNICAIFNFHRNESYILEAMRERFRRYHNYLRDASTQLDEESLLFDFAFTKKDMGVSVRVHPSKEEPSMPMFSCHDAVIQITDLTDQTKTERGALLEWANKFGPFPSSLTFAVGTEGPVKKEKNIDPGAVRDNDFMYQAILKTMQNKTLFGTSWNADGALKGDSSLDEFITALLISLIGMCTNDKDQTFTENEEIRPQFFKRSSVLNSTTHRFFLYEDQASLATVPV